MPEDSLKSELFQLLWQVCLFFFLPHLSGVLQKEAFSHSVLSLWQEVSGRESVPDCLSMPFQSSFSMHRFDQPLLYLQVKSLSYHLNRLPIDSLTSFFPPLVIGLTSFQFSMHIWVQLRKLNIALNIDATVPLVPPSFHQHPVKLAGAAPTELLTDLELNDT